MHKIRPKFQELIPGIRFDEPLARYSTFQVGGKADMFYQLTDTEELPTLIQLCQTYHVPFFVIGSGSNILFADEGFRGIIIKIETHKIEFHGTQVTADAGVLVAKLVQESVQQGLTGLEPWVGLPGTVGGAVRGNAGCNGLETSQILTHARIFDPHTNEIQDAKPEFFHYSYRDSKFKHNNDLILSATFQLQKSPHPIEKQKLQMEKFSRERVAKQPFGLTTGSFFKNPSPEQPAGMLIDRAGLKGKSIGKAQISTKHGNFFLNLAGATAKDIIELAMLAKREVKAKFDIDLEEEVQILSETGTIKLANL